MAGIAVAFVTVTCLSLALSNNMQRRKNLWIVNIKEISRNNKFYLFYNDNNYFTSIKMDNFLKNVICIFNCKSALFLFKYSSGEIFNMSYVQ